jgi:hypothetical protein
MAEYSAKEIRPNTATGPTRTYGGTDVEQLLKSEYITNWYYTYIDKNDYDGESSPIIQSYGPTIVRGGSRAIPFNTLDFLYNWYSDDSDKNEYLGGYYCTWQSSYGPVIIRGGLKEIDIKVLYAPERSYGGLDVMNVLKSFGPFRPDKIYDMNILTKSTVKTGGLVPSEPTNATIITNRNGFRINWGTPESDIDGRPLLDYGIFISDDGYNFSKTDTVSLTRYVYGDVFPTHTKYISIRASNFNGYGSKSTIFELNSNFDYDAQIAFARKTSENDMLHGLFSSHSEIDNEGNSVFFGMWTPQCDVDEIGRKKIIEFNAESGVNLIHILPIENTKYDIGSDDKPFMTAIGSEIYTDVIKTKTFRIHSGK